MFCVFSNLYHYITGSINSCMMSANLRASFQGCFNFLQDLFVISCCYVLLFWNVIVHGDLDIIEISMYSHTSTNTEKALIQTQQYRLHVMTLSIIQTYSGWGSKLS